MAKNNCSARSVQLAEHEALHVLPPEAAGEVTWKEPWRVAKKGRQSLGGDSEVPARTRDAYDLDSEITNLPGFESCLCHCCSRGAEQGKSTWTGWFASLLLS